MVDICELAPFQFFGERAQLGKEEEEEEVEDVPMKGSQPKGE